MEVSVVRVCESHRWIKGSGCRVLVVIALFAQLERRMRGTAGLGLVVRTSRNYTMIAFAGALYYPQRIARTSELFASHHHW